MRRGFVNIFDEAEGAPYGIAPRVYCAANPLRYTDPTGMDIWTLNDKGHCEQYSFRYADIFVAYKQNGSILTNFSMTFFAPNTFTMQKMSSGTVFESQNEDSNRKLFEFVSDNTSVEWGSFKTVDNNDESNYKTATSHDEGGCDILTDLLNDAFHSKIDVDDITHSHPNKTPYPSNFLETDPKTGKQEENGDIPLAKEVDNKIKYPLMYHIFIPGDHKYVHYNSAGETAINESPLNKN